ncbi:GNAT family N-acetyltransferase [Pseudochrobactrum sp. MP213Fo]|uniref:GNAT family N-acetyltransferase n=1 Tax=Pseudochrobactrum sp. MP213Fo TaxID=3022250 RepID=UPI003BA3B921
MIRFGVATDKMACIHLLRESHEAAGFGFAFKAAYAAALFDHHISTPQACMLVFEHNGEPQGLLMATCFEHPFGAGRYAKETVWYIAACARGRAALQMLDAYEAWALEQNCTAIGMASLISNDVAKLYERRGYAPIETHYLKSL